jgi:hypothetical protein
MSEHVDVSHCVLITWVCMIVSEQGGSNGNVSALYLEVPDLNVGWDTDYPE